ncbi:polyamine-transporting ATPase 13A3-like [Schistocerca cancellata]|uniref:polyamine-transporting ATPase 13A3-like n=1 Tax=Schistocerca cancellata TaxID=274614 RepID=UPI002117C224|nr:polyamine-transporting ATPase 13A3-like [Schistocerca cancellata]
MCGVLPNSHVEYESLQDETVQIIEDEVLVKCWGYKCNCAKTFLFYISSILLVGTPYLVLHWWSHYEAYLKCSRCSLSDADHVLLESEGQKYFHAVVTTDGICNDYAIGQLRYFIHQELKFIWSSSLNRFYRLHGLDDQSLTLSEILDGSKGHNSEVRQQMCFLYGENTMSVKVKSYWSLFVNEVVNPFYIFQVFSITLWSLDNYYYYAGCVLLLSALSIGISLWHTKQQSISLSKLAEESCSNKVTLQCENGKCVEVDSKYLVPGDVIIIPQHGCLMSCDAILLSGSCIVNESMLTGESVPVTKTQPSHSDAVYSLQEHKRHTLFSGTRVLQTRFYANHQVSALVVRTGFSTLKGELIRSIMFPKPIGFKFYQDSVKFILVLFAISLLGMAFCIYVFLRHKATLKELILRTLDVITIVVPPSLPAAMTSGTVYSQNRLKKLGVFCISPPRINVCGKMKVICFDKTGTLTEDGLDMWGVLPSNDAKFEVEPVLDIKKLPYKCHLVTAMATCHSLTHLEGNLVGDPLDVSMFEAINWELEEPASDTARFDNLAPAVVKPRILCGGEGSFLMTPFNESEIPYEVGILRQFPFTSAAQCMSVITRVLGSKFMTVYCKGAPEKIVSLSRKETVPRDLHRILTNYASGGFRIIALAYRDLDPKFSWSQAQRARREVMECDLTFLGLLMLCNSLKAETLGVIHHLQTAKLRCVMVTGDNILTAVSVARDCGMVLPLENVIQVVVTQSEDGESMSLKLKPIGGGLYPESPRNDYSSDAVITLDLGANWHFAVDGHSWKMINDHYPYLVPQIAAKGTIFARMLPDQKAQLVESLQNIDYIVTFCGDGANDCAIILFKCRQRKIGHEGSLLLRFEEPVIIALKTADVGVSLSEAEASVAAPFTSKHANIECVLHLAREGRCALVTSFGLFKYMALYSLIQFFSTLILYNRSSILGDMQFLYIDLVITTSLTLVMGLTGPSKKLVPQRPTGSLVSLANIVPLTIHVMLVALMQIASLLFLTQQNWFVPIDPATPGEHILSWENTTVFCTSCFQYLVLAALFSKGRPHRTPFYTNCLLTTLLITLGSFTAWLLVYPLKPVAEFFEVESLSDVEGQQMYRLYLLGFSAVHMILAFLVETCVADKKWMKTFLHCITRKREPKSRYKKVCLDMATNDTLLNYVDS